MNKKDEKDELVVIKEILKYGADVCVFGWRCREQGVSIEATIAELMKRNLKTLIELKNL